MLAREIYVLDQIYFPLVGKTSLGLIPRWVLPIVSGVYSEHLQECEKTQDTGCPPVICLHSGANNRPSRKGVWCLIPCEVGAHLDPDTSILIWKGEVLIMFSIFMVMDL